MIEGECLGKTEIDAASAILTGSAYNFTITIWERVTKDSKWKFFSGVSGQSSADFSEQLKLKKHEKNLNVYRFTGQLEVLSYTYRF